WRLSSDGTSELFNERWSQCTGMSWSESAGTGWKAAFFPADLERLLSLWESARCTNEFLEAECRIRGILDDCYRWFIVRAVLERQEDGQVRSWIFTATDIHDRKESDEKMARLYEEARESAERLKQHARALELSNHDLEQFAYVASHD